VAVVRPNQVWSTDITYIRLAHGFAHTAPHQRRWGLRTPAAQQQQAFYLDEVGPAPIGGGPSTWGIAKPLQLKQTDQLKLGAKLSWTWGPV